MPNQARVIVEGPTALPRMRWRVVLGQKEDSNGILRDVRTVELADETDVDALGVQRWRSLNMKSAQSDWMLVCEAALNLALEQEQTCQQSISEHDGSKPRKPECSAAVTSTSSRRATTASA